MSDAGLKRFSQRLQAIPQAAREAIQPVLQRQAAQIAGTMRYLAPDDPQTGAPDLKTSIAVTPGGQSTPAHSQPGGAHLVPENAVVITAGNSKVRYAHLVEFGTRARMMSSTRQASAHPGTSPQPFFWPAYRLHRKKALAAIKRGIGKAIKEAR